jgi:hypothetical protein
MKKILLFAFATLLYVNCMAQAQLAFPFQGGKEVMNKFFKENLMASPEIVQRRATGMVIFKFTADEKGKISKMIIYYADDPILVPPVIAALKKTNRKWIIPDHETFNDFILPVTYRFNTPATDSVKTHKEAYDYMQQRKPIFSTDQIPLNLATLLPAIMVTYDMN